MKQTTKTTLINLIKAIVFLALFLMIFGWTRDILRDKSESWALDMVLEQEDGSFDVILAGSSHMQYAIHPVQLFGEQGIAACNTSTAAQSIPTSYYVIREMIDRHDPELVVLDLFCLFLPDAYLNTARVHQAIDNFPLSRNKVEAINDLVPELKDEFYIDYLLYHDRWKLLTKEDYTGRENFNEKYQLLDGTMPFPEPFAPVPVEDTAPIPEVTLTYLKKIVDLCKETDTQLLLTVVPYRADIDNNNTSAIYQQQLYNTLAQYAQQWDVDFLNTLHILDELDFDFNTDMIEYSHANISGSPKISAYYGQYLRDHYDLPNRSQDPAYSGWYADYDRYLETVVVQ